VTVINSIYGIMGCCKIDTQASACAVTLLIQQK